MRWPLRNRIVLPMVGVMLGALVGVSVMNAYLAVRRTRSRIEHDVAQVTETLARSTFPLTDAVLRQMRGLSGAEYVLTGSGGAIVASSTGEDVSLALPQVAASADRSALALAEPIAVGKGRYFHAAVELQRPSDAGRKATLHILYPEESYRQAWRDVVYPPLLVGAGAIVLVIGLSLGTASHVTRPLDRLKFQVNEIAHGTFRLLPVPRRDDEIADLSRSVNRMAEMLARYEAEVRRNERLRTLGQLGGGIAHQIRNSVTGCRMAVELHARECPAGEESESLDVAKRQLELMEKYLQRFLSLGRTDAKPHVLVDLAPIVGDVVSLVEPTARHVGVRLEWRPHAERIDVRGDADALEQLLVNLVLNGIEAASRRRSDTIPAQSNWPAPLADGRQHAGFATETDDGAQGGGPQQVLITLERAGDEVQLAVEDSGAGPSHNVEGRLFEPFVTEKPDGTGLGLAVARETAVAHGGAIDWRHTGRTTRFTVTLPAAAPREANV